jgi:hypothetical protein
MNKNTWFCIFLLVLAGLSLGTVRKAEDPIRDTQTNGILYEQKKEEEKDGKKGPLMYHVKNNPRESFFIDPPFSKEKKGSQESAATKAPVADDTAGWWEEQPTDAPTAPEPSEPPEKALSQEEGAEGGTDREGSETIQPEASQEVRDTEPAKGDDYWW